MVYYIDCFVYIEESLQPWDKCHLIMVYDLFNVLLDSVLDFFLITKVIKRAQIMGFTPVTCKDPAYLKDPSITS